MNNTLDLNQRAIYSANNASMFSAGDSLAREGQKIYNEGLAVMQPREGWTQEQQEYAATRAIEWRDLVTKAYNDLLHRRSSWVPVIVAGPSNYPASRMSKRADAQMKAGSEWSEKMDRFLENTKKGLADLVPVADLVERYRTGRCSEPISSDDPAAFEKLTARLEYLKTFQESMKAMNAHYRKHKTMQGYAGISEESAAKLDHASVNVYSYQKKQPFQSYELQNNSANIARIEDRIKLLQNVQKIAAADNNKPAVFDGFRIEQHAQDNRIRIFFDEKPDEQTRKLIKSWGFKWSPNAGAWQRQLNGNGMYAAKQVAEKLAPNGPIKAQDDAQEITLEQFALRYAQA